MTGGRRGAMLGGYRLIERVGVGSSCEVYRAHDLAANETIALKVFRTDDAPSSAVAQLEAEVRAAARVDHPNVVRVLGHGELHGQAYIAMEFVEGTTLKARLLAAAGPLSAHEVISVLRQVGAALDHAHGAGVIHRDVKPSNILIDKSGHARLGDLGIAKVVAERTLGATRTGAGIGTPEFMSPEQVRGDPVTAAADLYALGVVAYQALTGHLPYRGEGALGTALAHLRARPPDPSRLNPALGRRTDAVIRRVLSKDPTRRQRTAEEFVSALSDALEADARQPKAGGSPALLGGARAVAAVGVAVIAAVAGILVADRVATSPVAGVSPTAVPTATSVGTVATPQSQGPRIGGRVTDPAGSPVANVRIRVFTSPQTTCCVVPDARTEESGAFSVAVPPGRYRLQFAPPTSSGLAPLFWPSATNYGRATEVTVSETQLSLDMQLSPGALVRGGVTGASGSPVAVANVVVRHDGGGDAYVFTLRTGADGSYEVRLPNGTYWVEAYPPGPCCPGAPAATTTFAVAGDTEVPPLRFK